MTKETYQELLRNPHYRCTQRTVTKDVCVCPKGFGDFECSTPVYKKCFLNITEPALYKDCSHLPDTPYYLYSLPGYDPCTYLNFTRS